MLRDPETGEVVARVVAARRAALRESGWVEDRLEARTLLGGALVGYFPSCSLFDGAAELVSRGYFDGTNEPAWDSWVAYDEEPADTQWGGLLVSYVPTPLVDGARSGVAVNPEGCLVSDADRSGDDRDRARWERLQRGLRRLGLA